MSLSLFYSNQESDKTDIAITGIAITSKRVIMQLESSCRKAFHMSRSDKAKERLSSCPKDYSYSEARRLLTGLGFEESNKGRTSGSRVKFYRTSDQRIILLHKPHPGDEMSIGAIKDLAARLEEMGEL